jgi:polyhydroxybutyrate depolymerase
MTTMRTILLAGVLMLACAVLSAQAADGTPLTARTWQVEDLTRQALLHIPASATSTSTPVVFAFHGHGGSHALAARIFACHTLWPEAIVVYMQGVRTPGALTDPEGKKTGWQSRPGDHNDRDLKFFDAVLASLKQDYKVDDRRIYATGFSHGGYFTYLLWGCRGEVLAAVAPCAATTQAIRAGLRPKPAMHVAGLGDNLVKWDWQKLTMEAVRRVNGCQAEGVPWAHDDVLTAVEYPSPGGTPFVAVTYRGSHAFPAGTGALIVRFFKEHVRP